MQLPLESIYNMQGFFWVLIRVSIMFFLLPLFGAKGVPALWKAGLSFVLALILTPLVPAPEAYPETMIQIVSGVICEILMGLILALSVKMLLSAVQIAGQFMSFQMGFAMARSMDPQTGVQSTVLSQFLYMFTILILFSVNGHHMFIHALASSFELAPPNSITFNPSIGEVIIKVSSQMFVIGVKMAAPIIVSLFLSNLCLGIVARTVPQVNILMIGFPINIMIGLILFGLVIVNISPLLKELIRSMGEVMMHLINLM